MKKIMLLTLIALLVVAVSAFYIGNWGEAGTIITGGNASDDLSGDKGEEFETAVFGGGCFWSIDAIFSQVIGTVEVKAGYAGGFVEDPTYEEVLRGDTGHAEVVRVVFDPEIISYDQLLEIYFSIHDPTTLNRQGDDVGEQYRSVILFTNPGQEAKANDFIAKLETAGVHAGPVVTEVQGLEKFYLAEEYHQQYYENNPGNLYCALVVSPKVEQFQEEFKDFLK